MAIKRPPFDFEIHEELERLINNWVDILEGKAEPKMPIDLVSMELYQSAREIPGSGHTNDYDEWVLRYYIDGGYKDDMD